MTFIAVSNSNERDHIITNNMFYPNIDLQDLRKSQRLDGTVTHERLVNAAINAIASVNNDLYEWRLEHIATGISHISDTNDEIIDGKSINEHRYLRAVYCIANANLIERSRNYDATSAGIKKSDYVDTAADDLLRDARFAIRDILNISRSTFTLL